ncbi:hypothetical protein CY652_21065 [Burkholderia sp. WAC0059]|uniref:hypothetical protein n=1 Tax=Burkholderia sp. WAC0059 TaxID=2066022 RepID=UPI000C7F249A|nr:hypothetical protein [Burkholderia sp. WAC0059]PLZ00367.1 hypothetical protein CY652_21065 [Burkholderia sp. WAC0059]
MKTQLIAGQYAIPMINPFSDLPAPFGEGQSLPPEQPAAEAPRHLVVVSEPAVEASFERIAPEGARPRSVTRYLVLFGLVCASLAAGMALRSLYDESGSVLLARWGGAHRSASTGASALPAPASRAAPAVPLPAAPPPAPPVQAPSPAAPAVSTVPAVRHEEPEPRRAPPSPASRRTEDPQRAGAHRARRAAPAVGTGRERDLSVREVIVPDAGDAAPQDPLAAPAASGGDSRPPSPDDDGVWLQQRRLTDE